MKSPETLHVLQAESVVPHEGTWIEINLSNYITKDENTVVPHEGTWIEIVIPWNIIAIVSVVPHEGTWIEISVLPLYLWLCHVVSHEGTWIEMEKKQCLGCLLSSFPTRERGLKSGYDLNFFSHFVSFPTQECGLKSRSHMRSL